MLELGVLLKLLGVRSRLGPRIPDEEDEEDEEGGCGTAPVRLRARPRPRIFDGLVDVAGVRVDVDDDADDIGLAGRLVLVGVR